MTNELRRWNWWTALKWRRSPAMTVGELAVIKALVPAHDPRTAQLLSQAVDAPEIKRQLVGTNGYRASISYVKNDSHLIDAVNDFVSPCLTATDTMSGRRFTFNVKVLRGGFLNDLRGTAEDGKAWPMEWDVDAKTVTLPIENWLPPLMSQDVREEILRRLAIWTDHDVLGIASLSEASLGIQGPASEGDIIAAEVRLGCELPAQYKEFVRICNGLSIRHGRPYNVFGTQDVFRPDTVLAESSSIVITDLYEEGVVLLTCGGRALGTTFVVRSTDDKPQEIGDLREHVKDSLEWAKALSERH